jgi:hypothetical protein
MWKKRQKRKKRKRRLVGDEGGRERWQRRRMGKRRWG